MTTSLDIEDFLYDHPSAPILDVRSESEYAHDHIPNSISFPLLKDEERAEVGTLYKKTGREKAIERGLEIVGPRMAEMVRKAKEIAQSDHFVKIYCWRGGMRSKSLAWLLQTAGMQTFILNGGYKTYRRYVQAYFQQAFQFRVLGGYTGSGKTEVLKYIKELGRQIIDLEGLANHRGSAFGSISMPVQPSTKMFENVLFQSLSELDITKPIWIEDESRNIGKIFLPPDIYQMMKNSPIVFIDCDIEVREKHLMALYGGASIQELTASLEKIMKRLGYELYRQALDCLERNQLDAFCGIVLKYYDRSYEGLITNRQPDQVKRIPIPSDWQHPKIAEYLVSLDI